MQPARTAVQRAFHAGVDRHWWSSETFDGRPLSEILAAHDIGALFRFLRSRGFSRAAIAGAVGLSESRVRSIMNSGQQVCMYEVLARIADGLDIHRGLMGLAHTSAPGSGLNPAAPGPGGGDPDRAADVGPDVASGGPTVVTIVRREGSTQIAVSTGTAQITIDSCGAVRPVIDVDTQENSIDAGAAGARVYSLAGRRAR
jgi:hypothetical protein